MATYTGWRTDGDNRWQWMEEGKLINRFRERRIDETLPDDIPVPDLIAILTKYNDPKYHYESYDYSEERIICHYREFSIPHYIPA